MADVRRFLKKAADTEKTAGGKKGVLLPAAAFAASLLIGKNHSAGLGAGRAVRFITKQGL